MSGIRGAVGAMAWVINTKGFVLARIGVGYTVKLFILCLLVFNNALAPYGLTHTAAPLAVA